MKKILFLLAVAFLTVIQAQAVLKEQSLNRTLGVLKLELRNNHIEQRMRMERMSMMQKAQHAQLLEYMQRCEQISLMMYSQNPDFTFDIAYACQQATTLHREMNQKNLPYDQIRTRILTEVARYDSLIYALEQLPPAIGKSKKAQEAVEKLMKQISDTTECDSAHCDDEHHAEEHHHQGEDEIYILSEQEQKDREICILHAKALRNNLMRILISITKDKQYYDQVNYKVNSLNDYAQHRYKMLQNDIFIKGGDNYFKLLKNLPNRLLRISQDFKEKYSPLGKNRRFSQWRGPQMIFVSFAMVFYLLIATILSNVILRWIVPKKYRTETYKKKRPAYIMTLGIVIFSTALIVIMNVFPNFGPVQMATKLMLNMTWLMLVVMVSLLIRLEGNQMKYGVRMYMPFMVIAFVVILFRIVLIPNTILNIVFPPILLLFTIWQILVAKGTRRFVPLSDKIYNIISLATIIISLIISLVGYTLLAVQITIWWTFQLAFIQTITCLYDIMEMYEDKYLIKRIRRKFHKHSEDEELSDEKIIEHMKKGDYVSATWLYDLINRAIVPILGVLSVVFSISFAADTFEMRAVCQTIFESNFIDIEGVMQISLFKLCLVIGTFFVFKYLNYSIRSFYFHFKKNIVEENQELNHTLVKNIVAIIVWGIFIIFSMVLLKVPKSGIEVVSAGLATGMGFAMKDLLENFFYGISLMTGRVRVGDYIECDGVFGKVESITYQSTQIIAVDGSVIAFLNSSLFSKNFKNLTRSDQYELIKIPVGVAYGTDINKVRGLILEGMKQLEKKTEDGRDTVDPRKPVSVAFSDFGASSVDLLVVQWVLVDQKVPYQAAAKEIIYNILNDNGIEIPFPQQDIYIRKITSESEN